MAFPSARPYFYCGVDIADLPSLCIIIWLYNVVIFYHILNPAENPESECSSRYLLRADFEYYLFFGRLLSFCAHIISLLGFLLNIE